jgi:predicted TIM-barrel fold metal-dependent hydrolase
MKRLLINSCCLLALFSCSVQERYDYYAADDFGRVPKIDAHYHYNTADTRYIRFADSINMWFISVNVDAGRSVREQFETARALKQEFPDMFFFLGTFSVDNFGQPGFAEDAIEKIRESVAWGASGIKVWKNIGMDLKDSQGNYVMIDNPAFHPVFEYIRKNRIPLLGHLGEPLNCWLPVEEMTVGNDRWYFTNYPQYHMYLHPEAPSYRDQINARDNMLKQHDQLVFSGAHLASLEWSVDELAGFFETFPDAMVDLSARLVHLQHQSLEDHQKVRDFLIKYQDRIKYGTDFSFTDNSIYQDATALMLRRWTDDWIYLATDSTIIVNNLDDREVQGLKLPASVIDKIYYSNAVRFYNLF